MKLEQEDGEALLKFPWEEAAKNRDHEKKMVFSSNITSQRDSI